ncbi:MAG: S8 family serine peptidase [Planctomycetota bacterium]
MLGPSVLRPLLRSLAVLVGVALLAAGSAAQLNQPDPLLQRVPWNGIEVLANEVLVQFRPGTPQQIQSERHAQAGTQLLGLPGPQLARVRGAPGTDVNALMARYAAFAEVSHAQPNALHRKVGTPTDPKWSQQWGLPKVNAPAAWDLAAGHPGTVIAVLDSGVDMTHPDLDDHYAWGLDTFAGDSVPEDLDGHGTHCAGIAAAETNNGIGVAGLGFACRFAAYRCGNDTFPSSALVAAIHDARLQGARVLSMSWGSTYNDPAIRTALQAARDAGCVLVAAAGNDNTTSLFYPAAHAFVIAVGASTSSDARASFSNYGSWVDVAAPGLSIYSTWKGKTYSYSSGTSMACPMVAGLAGLLYAHLGGPRSVTSATAIREAIESSAVPVGSWIVHGRINALAAVQALGPAGPPQLEVPATVAAGASFSWTWSLAPGHTTWLLIAVDPGTFLFQGQPILAQTLLMLPVPTDASGQGALPLTAPAAAAGLTVYSQLAATGQGPVLVSAIATTAILP